MSQRHSASQPTRGSSKRGGRGGGGGRPDNTIATSSASRPNNCVYFHLNSASIIEVRSTHTIDPKQIKDQVVHAAVLNRMRTEPEDLNSQFSKLVKAAQSRKSKSWLVRSVNSSAEWDAITKDEELYPAVSVADPERAFLTKKLWRDAQTVESEAQVDQDSGAKEASISQPHDKAHLSICADGESGTVVASATGDIHENSAIRKAVDTFVVLNSKSEKPRNFFQLCSDAARSLKNDPTLNDWRFSFVEKAQQYTDESKNGPGFAVLSLGRHTILAYTRQEAERLDLLPSSRDSSVIDW